MKKILIIAGGLQIGGAERVAANISKYAPKGEYEFHYVVFDGIENVYGPEIEAAGGRVFTFPSPAKGYAAYLRNLCSLIRQHKYAAIHSHTMFNSGLNLAAAWLLGVRGRIAHSHTTRTERKVSSVQKGYEQFMRLLIRLFATDLFSCGIEAGHWMFGEKAFDQKGVVISNGIDTDAFAFSEDARNQIRSRYSLDDRFVIGHSGTLLPLKNQEFLIRLMPKVLKKKPTAMLMLLGNGSEEFQTSLEKLAEDLQVQDRVIFCGGVSNVHTYLSAFDVFAFPSLREGTPLALIEAQTNGLPCIISDRIPKDVHLTDLVTALSLDEEDLWVEKICSARRREGEYAGIIKSRGYGAHQAYEPIYRVYSR